MSFFYIRPYFYAVDNNSCPISIYSRFFIALLVLGVGLTASVIIKELPQNHTVPTSLNLDETSIPVKGSLESFPRDFTLNSSAFNRLPPRNDLNGPVHHLVGKKAAELSALSMGKTYPGASQTTDVDDRPSLPPNTIKRADNNNPEEEKLKNGYIRHLTSNGDCLKNLAEKYLHNADRWEEIYNLNKNVLTNKNVVPIGIVLIIPTN